MPIVSVIEPDSDPFVLAAMGAAVARSVRDGDAEVLNARYGLDGRSPETLAAIGNRLGLSRERIRQLETRGLSRLRTAGRRGQNFEAQLLVDTMERQVRLDEGNYQQRAVLAAVQQLPHVPMRNALKLLLYLSGRSQRDAAEEASALLEPVRLAMVTGGDALAGLGGLTPPP